MKNKKGWIKIFEASISIMLILGFLVIIYSQTIERPRSSENLLKWEGQVLDELKNNRELRAEVLRSELGECDNTGQLYLFIEEKIKDSFPGFGFTCRICGVNDVCGIPGEYKSEIFSEERIVSSTPDQFLPKKIRVFVWREE